MSIEIVNTIQDPTARGIRRPATSFSTSRRRPPRGINETTAIHHLLEGLSNALDMTLVYPPLVARFPFAANELSRFVESLKAEGIQANAVNAMEQLLARRQNEEAGISGVTVWLESHAAIHTWTEENFFSFDAYSCKDFDPEKALDYVLQFFDVQSYKRSRHRAYDRRAAAGAGARFAPEQSRLSRTGPHSSRPRRGFRRAGRIRASAR